jgi:hypothetical protein
VLSPKTPASLPLLTNPTTPTLGNACTAPLVPTLAMSHAIVSACTLGSTLWLRVPYFEALMLEDAVHFRPSVYVWIGTAIAAMFSGWTLHTLFNDNAYIAVGVFSIVMAGGILTFVFVNDGLVTIASMVATGFGGASAAIMVTSAVMMLVLSKKGVYGSHGNQVVGVVMSAGYGAQALMHALRTPLQLQPPQVIAFVFAAPLILLAITLLIFKYL